MPGGSTRSDDGSSRWICTCSGVADVGAVADQAARRLHRNGTGRMVCLAAVAGRVEPILSQARTAERVMAIDGCSNHCVKKVLNLAGVERVEHLVVTDLGMEKGKTELSHHTIHKVVEAGARLLAGA